MGGRSSTRAERGCGRREDLACVALDDAVREVELAKPDRTRRVRGLRHPWETWHCLALAAEEGEEGEDEQRSACGHGFPEDPSSSTYRVASEARGPLGYRSK